MKIKLQNIFGLTFIINNKNLYSLHIFITEQKVSNGIPPHEDLEFDCCKLLPNMEIVLC